MYTLSTEQKVKVVSAMVEGNSIRSTERMTGVHRDTIMRLIVRVGENCERVLDEHMRGLRCRTIQCDEIWTYVGVKQRRLHVERHDPIRMGDQYVFVALDAETKVVPCFRVGKRDVTNTWYFMRDLESRLTGRVQITTDGFPAYRSAVEDAFSANVDFAQLIKLYGKNEAEPYAPAQITNALAVPVSGNPKYENISTSHVERQNLTIRMQLRRFTRLTNAFSKKIENLRAALALHFAWYNFCRVHSSLRVTPAMAAGVSRDIWPLESLLA